MSPASHLVQILLPTRTGSGQPVTQARFEELLQELTDKYGGATTFVRAPGQGLWDSGGDVERDNIAVIEVMTDEIDLPFWQPSAGSSSAKSPGRRSLSAPSKSV